MKENKDTGLGNKKEIWLRVGRWEMMAPERTQQNIGGGGCEITFYKITLHHFLVESNLHTFVKSLSRREYPSYLVVVFVAKEHKMCSFKEFDRDDTLECDDYFNRNFTLGETHITRRWKWCHIRSVIKS
jgi:hypothetical protein